MNIDVTTNARDVSRDLVRVFEDQVPYSAARAVRATALDFQKAQRAHQREIFTVRRPTFVDRAVKIREWPTKAKPEAEVAIDPPGGSARADILTKFEEETRKAPISASRLAVPHTDVPKTGAGIVRANFRPGRFAFREVGRTAAGGIMSRGEQRTFSVRKPDGTGFIAQRVNRSGQSRLRTLYIFEPEVPIRPELHFEANAERTVRDRFEVHFAQEFNRAIGTAR